MVRARAGRRNASVVKWRSTRMQPAGEAGCLAGIEPGKSPVRGGTFEIYPYRECAPIGRSPDAG